MTMIKWSRLIAITITFVSYFVCTGPAISSSNLYDMSRFLNEPHPFAVATKSTVQPLATNSTQQGQKSKIFSKIISSKTRAQQPPSPITNHQTNKFTVGWLSELRLGALKHAVSLVGNTTKETGMDGNIELLYQTPSWLEWFWSPRPMTGASANASSNNTDIAYTGLTWEWGPWSDLILNFSFGFAIHNGELKYDSAQAFPEDAGRHREFGCRWLFRETLESGWLLAERHAVTLMWSHYSHGGLCDDKNEGLDNVGIRYGFRF